MRPHTISPLGLALLLVFTGPALAVVHVDRDAAASMYDGLTSDTASPTLQPAVNAAMPVSAHQTASLGTTAPGALPKGGMAGDRHDLFPGTVGTMSPNMIIQIGVGRNSYPGGGDDLPNFFGVYEGAIDDYGDPYDVEDPGAPPHCLNLIFRGDQYGDNPSYPENGLAWDIREPYDALCKIWKIEVVLPDEGYTYDLYYDFDPTGYPLPDGWCCFVDMDGEITGENYMNLDLYELRLSQQTGYLLTDLAQTGGSETWYILVGHSHVSRAYVDCNAPGPYHDGLTWDTAFLTIQEGIRAVDPGGQVWVADGTYVENVVMRHGIAIYGGFLGAEPGGYETELAERDFVNNVTTVDGNQSGSCVVMAVDARVDGITITNGNGTLVDGVWYGGGFYCVSLGQTGSIANNKITANRVGGVFDPGYGGGIYCDSSSPTVSDNHILGNRAGGYFGGGLGGGIYCKSSSPVVVSNTISGNGTDGGAGGGVGSDWSSSPDVMNNVITGNGARDMGGGVYCGGPALVANNIISRNSTGGGGGGIHCEDSAIVTNNVISANNASGGGGLQSGSPSVTVSNNVVTENQAEVGGGIAGAAILLHNDFWNNSPDDYYGCEPGEGDISADPLFVDPENGDFHLSSGSPCIDAGDNEAPGLPEYDFEGDPRIIDGDGDGNAVVDIGADEYAFFAFPATAVDQNAPGPEHDGLSWDTAFLTIQEGVDAATPSGEVWVADGTYVENVVMGQGVAIYGGFLGAEPGGYETERDQRDFESNLTTIDGNQSGSCVTIAVDARVDGFTITNGYAANGGGIYCEALGETGVIVNNTITENEGYGGVGAGIHCSASSPLVSNNAITANCYHGSGGGIYCGNHSSPDITSNTINSNVAEGGDGGGILCDGYSCPAITGNTIAGNAGYFSGGGIYSSGGSSPRITHNTIRGNSACVYGAFGSGAGVHCGGDTSAYIAHNTITGNGTGWWYGDAGGVYCGGSTTVTRNVIVGNSCSGNGAGLLCNGSSVVTHNVIVNNVASVCDDWFGGGGVFCADTSTVANNLIAGNRAEGDEYILPFGGGVLCHLDSPTLTSNTIFGNTTNGGGGGVFTWCEDPHVIANNIIACNSAWTGGGICSMWGPSSMLRCNNMWNNSPDDYYGCEPGEGDISEDPLFLDSENGDYHLSFGSPCIDAGWNDAPALPETDWDGEQRIVNGIVDIGADEFLTWTTTAPDPQPECDGPLFGESQSGFPAWVWFSIPMTPAHSADPNDVLGFICSGVLWRWDKYGKCHEAYSPPFFDWELSVGDSYILGLLTAVTNPSYEGLSPFIPWTFEFKLGRQGWTWVGMPGLAELQGDDFMSFVMVKYPSDDAGACRTAGQDYGAIPDNWISWGWPYWNTWRQGAETFTPYAPFGHSTCYPWVGYRVWVNVGAAVDEGDPDQVTLIWPYGGPPGG